MRNFFIASTDYFLYGCMISIEKSRQFLTKIFECHAWLRSKTYTRTYVFAAAGRLTISADFELSKAKTDLASAFIRLLLRTKLLIVLFLVLQRLNLSPWLSQYICLLSFPSRNGIKKKKFSVLARRTAELDMQAGWLRLDQSEHRSGSGEGSLSGKLRKPALSKSY